MKHDEQPTSAEEHKALALRNYLAGLTNMIGLGHGTIGWLRAYPNEITNAEKDLLSVLNLLEVALIRANGGVGEVSPVERPQPPQPRIAVTFDADGDLVES